MSDKALLKQRQGEVARHETELRNPAASKCDCARKKDVQIQKMEKEMAELRKQRDLAESRLEDFMRLIEHHHQALKYGTPHFGNHTDKWKDGSAASETSGVVNLLDTRSFISDDDDDDDDDLNEVVLPMHSENPSDEYCKEVQCIEIEETYSVVCSNDNHKDEKEETKNVVGHSEDHANEDERSIVHSEDHANEDERSIVHSEDHANDDERSVVHSEDHANEDERSVVHREDHANEDERSVVHSEDHANDDDERSVGQNVNHGETVPGSSTPPENLREERQESHEIVFPAELEELGFSVSRNDSMSSSCGSNSTGIPTPLGEEGGISTIQSFVDGLKAMANRHQEFSNAEASGKMERDLGRVDGDFERQRKEILELWQSCNVSLVRRTYFFLLFKGGDEADSVYIGVELRRLLFMKDRFSQGKQVSEGGETLTLSSSLKALHKERKMLSKLVSKRFSEEERTRIYHKFGIAVNSKRRKLQLANELWSNPKDMSQVMESADVVSKLVKFTEQGKSMKEMFGLPFTPSSFLTSNKAHGWRKNMPSLF
ncbi:ATP binding microtubule motor family protein [Raphanus sativus]|uniref:Kinesin-like protein KIN-7F n=1 Tax=Raphanus sativus TaxID=3726 RepID=A0A6J0NAH5_RAPSA|nr:kinesin-like protein KIN-7F [Raphanus sativus]KAJ4898735.1 ATP binding microtubule motor family protein [Raphanus sativus]